MTIAVRLATALLVIAAAPVAAEDRAHPGGDTPNGPPAVVTRHIEADKAACDGKVVLEPGFIRRKDVNGDGVPDYILYYGRFLCGAIGNAWDCGSIGCREVVFVSRPHGAWTKVIDTQAKGFDFATIHGRPTVTLTFPYYDCGKDFEGYCQARLVWDGSTFKSAKFPDGLVDPP